MGKYKNISLYKKFWTLIKQIHFFCLSYPPPRVLKSFLKNVNQFGFSRLWIFKKIICALLIRYIYIKHRLFIYKYIETFHRGVGAIGAKPPLDQ